MFFPPNSIDNVYIVFQLSHSHLEVPIASNIEVISKSIEESRKTGMGRIVVPLSEVKYFIQKTKNIMIMKFKDGEQLDILCTVEEIMKALANQKDVRHIITEQQDETLS